MRRAEEYMLEIGRMGEDRWPRICWREEMRGIKNNRTSKWGKMVKRAVEGTGDGESTFKFLIEEDRVKLEKNLENGIRIKRDQNLQKNWSRIDRSCYCRNYRDWKKEPGREKYWGRNSWGGDIREQRARLRCGNLGREKSKGFKENMGRVCNKEEENLEHIWKYREAREHMEEGLVRAVEGLGLAEGGDKFCSAIIKVLQGDPNKSVYRYSKKFEEIARDRAGRRDM